MPVQIDNSQVKALDLIFSIRHAFANCNIHEDCPGMLNALKHLIVIRYQTMPQPTSSIPPAHKHPSQAKHINPNLKTPKPHPNKSRRCLSRRPYIPPPSRRNTKLQHSSPDVRTRKNNIQFRSAECHISPGI